MEGGEIFRGAAISASRQGIKINNTYFDTFYIIMSA